MRAGLWLLLVSSIALAQGPRFSWPKVPVLEAAPAAQEMRVNGVPVHLVALKVKEDPRRLLQTYADAFVAAHLYIPPDKDQLQLAAHGPMLTALDPVRQLTYTVILQPQPDGTTTVILGEANFALRDPTQASDFAPIFPGGTNVLRSSQEASQVIAFDARASSAEVIGFYRTVLPTLGYQPDEKDAFAWRRGEDRLQLTAAKSKAGLSVVLMLRRASGP